MVRYYDRKKGLWPLLKFHKKQDYAKMMFCSDVALFFAAQVNKLVRITAVFKEP